MNSFFYVSLLKHYLQATPVDILHSPFVFDIHRLCMQSTSIVPFQKEIESKRTQLLKNRQHIQMMDYGAGSFFGQSHQKKISSIVKQHVKPAKVAQMFARLAMHLPVHNVVEIGTSFGLSTAYLYKAIQSKNINPYFYTLEGNPEIANIARDNFKSFNIQDINLTIGNFDDILVNVLQNFSNIDLAYLDGNHRKAATLKYFEQVLPYLHNDSIVIVDDIYWSKDMHDAWTLLCKNPSVRVSVNYFFFGLLFFRKEQAKQDFKLRIF